MSARKNVTVIIPFKRDGNREWLQQAIGSLPRNQRYLLLENDGELAEALNEGLKTCGTEFVFRLDADDMIRPGALDFLTDLAYDADVSYPSFLYTGEDLKPIGDQVAAPFCRNRLYQRNYIPGTSLYRPEKALAVGGYREMPILEDWDLWVRMAKAGARFKGVPEAVYVYRRHEGGRNRVPAADYGRVTAEIYQQVIGTRPELQATFYHQDSFATTYWRCLLPARHLPGQALGFPYITHDDEEFSFPEHQGAAIWQFPCDVSRALLMSQMREEGRRVLVEADDSYFERGPYDNGWVEKADREGTPSRAWFRKAVEAFADGVIVTTPHLAKRYRGLNDNIFVCPNQIDPDDWPDPAKPEDGIFRIGWFASPSHRDDAKLIRRAIEWASRQTDVEVVTVGFDPLWQFARRHIPWSNDMGVYRRLVQQLDVGLAPVIETPWASCRSDLKALEYGIAAVTPVLSDAIPYQPYDGPCLRAKDAKGFLRAVQHLVGNRDEAKTLALEAREYVLANRTMERNIGCWREAIQPEETCP